MRLYRYIGPAESRETVRPDDIERAIGTPVDLADWLATRDISELPEPFTFVIDPCGVLRLAPRRSEHVACAAASPVLSAGEITFARAGRRWAVIEVSNQSTGYCPDVSSWPAVENALVRADLDHPGGFTYPIVFRRCPHCHERNIVKDAHFACTFCDTELPATWNLDDTDGRAMGDDP